MIKLISLMKRKEGMTREEFAKWAVEEHSPIGKRFPGIRKYHISVLRADQPETEFDGVFELWFDSMEALDAALASPVGIEAREDAMAHASKRIHLRTEENIIVE
ncbi:MAG: EthD family reductase [Chloroflexi bacterium]|nr:EthD family reductase [Chloroflexota bacterium]